MDNEKPKINRHWVVANHICKYCGQNLTLPTTSSECPKIRKPKLKEAKPNE